MSVLIDTTIWSLALRRRRTHLNDDERRLVNEWERLVRANDGLLIGAVRQEVLSGIRQQAHFDDLREKLAAFEDAVVRTDDYEQAARFFNACRSRGITGTDTDLLICALAHRFHVAIFSTDPDFRRYAKVLPIRLHFTAADGTSGESP